MQKDLRTLFQTMDHDERRAASKERELAEWRDTHRFCGRCGAGMAPHLDPRERAMVCPSCGYTAYPAIAPAVIALVTRGDEVLLQRNTHYRSANWSLVAGFVEPGEDFEEAVRREVREEASIEIRDIRYVSSQTWPFPSNIMVGFRAEYAGGELTPDGEEVVESGWFRRDALPAIPPPGSIARQMLEAWVAGEEAPAANPRFFEATPEHAFEGRWITTAEFAALPVRNVFHRQLDRAARDAIRPVVQNRHVLFRAEFPLDRAPESARLFFSADDYAKLYVNGVFAGQGPAAGYPCHALYLSLDVAPLLRPGRNVLAVHSYYQGLVNRVWTSGDDVHGFLCDLVCDGRTVLASGPGFRCRLHSGYSACGTVGYQTQFLERYDAGAPEAGFERPDFDDSEWAAAALADPARWSLFPSPLPPLVFERVAPVSILREPGRWRIDFGAHYVGAMEMCAQGPAGAEIGLLFGQELNPDGSVRHDMRCNCDYRESFVLSGGSDELRPFDYKSFRYAELLLPEGVRVDESSLALVARHMPFRLAERCAYDDPDIRRIWDLAVRTLRYGVQEQIQDCMDREKGYYLGDGVYSLFTWCLLVGDYAPMRKFVDDFLRTSFITPGLMTCANCSFMQEIAEYPLMLFLLLPVLVRYGGGADFVRERLPRFRAILEAYRRDYARPDGLLQNLDKWCVVEWPREMRDGYDADVEEGRVCTDLHVAINAWYVGAVRIYNALVRDLGGAAPFEGADALLAAFRAVFYDPERKLFRDREGSGHASFPGNVYPWFLGLHPDDGSSGAILDFVRAKGVTAGMLFTTVPLFAALQREGAEELLRRFLLDEGAWLRMLREGATATFEAWGKDVKWNTSLFHLTLASVALFLVPRRIGREVFDFRGAR